jgi:hypothetical protein
LCEAGLAPGRLVVADEQVAEAVGGGLGPGAVDDLHVLAADAQRVTTVDGLARDAGEDGLGLRDACLGRVEVGLRGQLL